MENNIQYTTEPWHLTAYEFHYNTPSRRDNMTYTQEIFQRTKGYIFNVEVSQRLLLKIWLKIKIDVLDVGASCLFLTAKITDNRRDLNLISDLSARISLKQMQQMSSDHEINKWRHKILKYESIIFFVIYPYLEIKLPFQFLFMFRDSLTGYDQEIVNRLIGCSFQLLMDCSKTISAAAIFLAAKSSDIPLNDDPRAGACWFELAKVEDINTVAAAVDYILQSYTTGPVVKKF
ncbi:14852_t:CDS:2, partial [Dentiscutata heterogama]